MSCPIVWLYFKWCPGGSEERHALVPSVVGFGKVVLMMTLMPTVGIASRFQLTSLNQFSVARPRQLAT